MRGLRHVLFGACLAGIATVLAGCTGMGLGEGGGANSGPIPPPNFNDPIYKGQLSGQVMFEPGFLHNWLMVQKSGGGPRKGSLSIDRDREFYRSLVVRISGPKGRREVKVSEDGTFDFGTIHYGAYTLVVVGRGPLALTKMEIEGKAGARVTIRILGADLADIDHDENRTELVVERIIDYRSEEIAYRRTIPPLGDVRTILADGTVEVQGPDGTVKVYRSDGLIDYRYDPSNRFVDEELESDTGLKRKGRKAKRASRRPKDPLLAKVTGKGKLPLVLDVSLRGIGGQPPEALSPGDLAVLEVKTDANGGPPVGKVTAEVYSHHGSPRSIVLHDDGGAKDVRQGWAGMQSSLDRQKSDGVFTLPIPLDAKTCRYISASQIVITATNERLGTSQPASYHIYMPQIVGKDAPDTTLPGIVSRARLLIGPQPPAAPGGTRTFTAEAALKSRPSHVPAGTVYGPDGLKRLLTEVAGVDGEGGVILRSTPMPLSAKGVYTIVLSDPSGEVYCSSTIVGPRELAGEPPSTGSDDE